MCARRGINVCSGGIVGMGETRADRVGFIHTLATLPQHPESVPVNALVPVKGTVLGDMLADTPLAKIDDIEFVRTIAVARITMPMSMVRLSAGRESMSEATQALCFMAGANSIFTGDKLLTAANAGDDARMRPCWRSWGWCRWRPRSLCGLQGVGGRGVNERSGSYLSWRSWRPTAAVQVSRLPFQQRAICIGRKSLGSNLVPEAVSQCLSLIGALAYRTIGWLARDIRAGQNGSFQKAPAADHVYLLISGLRTSKSSIRNS
jgi:hypothetical protein